MENINFNTEEQAKIKKSNTEKNGGHHVKPTTRPCPANPGKSGTKK